MTQDELKVMVAKAALEYIPNNIAIENNIINTEIESVLEKIFFTKNFQNKKIAKIATP